MKKKIQIIIFCKYPVPGLAKTRLIPALGSKGAAQLHRRMTDNVVSAARNAQSSNKDDSFQIKISCTGEKLCKFKSWLGQDLKYSMQPSGGLGLRLQAEFKSAFQEQVKYAITIGADVPGITSDILRLAGNLLQDNDIVIGPAVDGGYYLIGMKSDNPELFNDIAWGTEQVYQQTLNKIKQQALSVVTLPILNDIDRPEDLEIIRNDSRFAELFSD